MGSARPWVCDRLYELLIFLASSVMLSTASAEMVPAFRVVVISDTHNVFPSLESLPDGDLLIHCGDFTADGEWTQLREAANWLQIASAKYKHGIVAVAGNHDKPLDEDTWLARARQLHQMCLERVPPTKDAAEHPEGERTEISQECFWNDGNISEVKSWFTQHPDVTLLSDESWERNGIHIYGSPWIPLPPARRRLPADNPKRTAGFCRDSDFLREAWERIPPGLDILVTHGPPLNCPGALDESRHKAGVPHADGPFYIGDGELMTRMRAMEPIERPKVNYSLLMIP